MACPFGYSGSSADRASNEALPVMSNRHDILVLPDGGQIAYSLGRSIYYSGSPNRPGTDPLFWSQCDQVSVTETTILLPGAVLVVDYKQATLYSISFL